MKPVLQWNAEKAGSVRIDTDLFNKVLQQKFGFEAIPV